MERIAPTHAAASWDNVGLLAGDHAWPLRRVLLTIDFTAAVLDESIAGRFDAVISYHPPIFKATKRMEVDRTDQTGLAAEAIAHQIALYSPHTALDAAPGGTNDVIADICEIIDAKPFQCISAVGCSELKLVVFVPEDAADQVAEAAFRAGAGRIGAYEKCSYRGSGHGTFFGTEGTAPRIGKRLRLERVAEARLEVVLPAWLLEEVLSAVRRSHPYEVPAIDVYELKGRPELGIGQGRVGLLSKPTRLDRLARHLQRKTGARTVTIVGDPGAMMKRGLVCVGAAGDLPFHSHHAVKGRGDVLVTGEIRHHNALEYERYEVAAIALGHWASERPVLKPLAARLRKELPGVEFIVSRADRDPFRPI
jgi:dinuclear metal center YbgI/SA1388 family protein